MNIPLSASKFASDFGNFSSKFCKFSKFQNFGKNLDFGIFFRNFEFCENFENYEKFENFELKFFKQEANFDAERDISKQN